MINSKKHSNGHSFTESKNDVDSASVHVDVMIRCPNPCCSDGYVPRKDNRSLLRVCPSCDGFGYLRSISENRKRYYAIRNLASELELQSRIGRELSHSTIVEIDTRNNMKPAMINEHMIPSSISTHQCLRVS